MNTTFWKRNRSFLLATCTLFIVRGTFADQNRVPSGSMEPTIQVGDHILVNRIAYDLKIPFSEITLAHFAEPQAGEIIVFHNPQTDVRMVKRLIGLPGDHLIVRNGIIFRNGELVPGSQEGLRKLADSLEEEVTYQEHFGIHLATIKRIKSLNRLGDLEITIPKDHYFAMGDNRDNSLDSRSWGLIPKSKIVGRAEGVLFNVNWWPSIEIRSERLGLRFT